MTQEPKPGEVWLDYEAYRTNRKHRELLVLSVTKDHVRVHSISGGLPGGNGVPLRYFFDGTMIFQGYWATKHQTLPRLESPFNGHSLAQVARGHQFTRLHGTANLVNAIVPTRAPSGVTALNRDFRAVVGVTTDTPVSRIPPGVAYLELRFQRMGTLHRAYYQKQRNAWHLVRTLMYKELPPIARLQPDDFDYDSRAPLPFRLPR